MAHFGFLCVFTGRIPNPYKEESIMKKTVCTAITLLLLLTLCACGRSEEERHAETVDRLNQNSDLPFALTLPETELGDVSAYSRIEGWGCWGLQDEDASITISGYPDVHDDYHVTDIYLLTPKYSVFGLKVGDTAHRAAEVLKPEGYKLAPDERGWGTCYLKDGVAIYPDYGQVQETISGLTVYVLCTNVEDFDF